VSMAGVAFEKPIGRMVSSVVLPELMVRLETNEHGKPLVFVHECAPEGRS